MKKVTLFWLAATLLAGCSGLVSESAAPVVQAQARAVSPVQLFYSVGGYDRLGYSYFAEHWLDGFVEIENLAFSKQVTVVYRTTSAGATSGWTSYPAAFVKSLDNNKELWKFSLPHTSLHLSAGGVSYEFALSYKVAGTEYWDNNGGKNYTGGTLGKSIVLKDSAYAYYVTGPGSDLVFDCSIRVKNLAYSKKVTVRYTQDNWLSFKEVDAKYASTNPDGTENWNLRTVLTSAEPVKYCISYTVNGGTAWDNNFKDNYSLTLPVLN